MHGKHVVKWVVLMAILVSLSTAAIPGAADAPQDAEPSAISCGDSAVCAMSGTALYVKNTGGGASIYGNSMTNGIGVRGKGSPGVYGYSYHGTGVRGKSETGYGVKAQSTDDEGVFAISTGGSIADNGVFAQTNSTDGAEAGVYGYSTAAAAGVYGRNYNTDTSTAASYGVRAYSLYGHGVYSVGGGAADDYGGYFTGYGGLRVDATGVSEPGYGIYVTSDSAEAGRFTATNDDGIRVYGAGIGFYGAYATSSHSYGVVGNTDIAGGYGLYTTDKIYTGGGCVGCTSMLIAQNGGDTPLEPGDVVAVVGIAEGPTEFYGRPALAVRKVDGESSQGVVGVVEGRYVRHLLTKEDARLETQYVEVPDPEGKSEPDRVAVEELLVEETVVEDAYTTTEPAAPGDYLTLAYRGLILVKADASSGAIQVGDLLTSGNAPGWAVKAPATEKNPRGAIIGKAVEPLAEGQRLIWVLVDLQ